MSDPAVSVIMSALNAERTVGVAIRSILAQSFRNFELIVIDDGSSDGTRAVVRAFEDSRLRLVGHAERKGLATRLNEGIALAQGEYIARMDADDIAYPERFAKQHAFLQANPDVDLLGCAAIAFKGACEPIGMLRVAATHAQICAHPGRGFDIPHPTWFGRRNFFRAFPYDARALRAQDQDLLLRAHRTARYANLPDVLLGYRHEAISARNIVRGRLQYCRALDRTWGAERAYGRLMHGLATQALRTVVGVSLLAAGLEQRLVSRRFAAANEVDVEQWVRVSAALASLETAEAVTARY